MINVLNGRAAIVDVLTGRERRNAQVESALARAETIAHQAGKLEEIARRYQAENHKLRRAYHMQPHSRIVTAAYESARKLAALHLAGLRTGRRVATQYGISERYFWWGRALCELASIYVNGEFTTSDTEIIEGNLQAAMRSAERDFWLLVRRVPPSRRPKFVTKR